MSVIELPKNYDAAATEPGIYQRWLDSGFFNPEACIEAGVTKADAKPFTIMMPPPNVTGILHMGHAMMLTLEDVMIRYARMRGYRTLWLPGTDHAAIATQARVEKDIYKKEGKSRHDLGREEFLRRVEQFAKESHETIGAQIKVMGASCDWSREAFTLDEKRNLAVRTMFKRMYDDGLIYRGNRIVNWDPKGQTVISDDELVYTEQKGKFYTFKYGPFNIGTARPETKFGDKYVVMHPDDKRYAEYLHGQKLQVEWINGIIEATIIKDPVIDMEFGTGVMTITPWHSREDFALAEKYKLDKEQIIDTYGKLLPVAGEFSGMKINEAREKIVEKLQAKGLLVSIDENYINRVATAERTGGTIEPQIMLQWFVDVNKKIPGRNKSLKELMREPIADNRIRIIPEHWSKTYFHWIDNLHDWCISRQIWYGHRIPVWYRGEEVHVGEEPTDAGPSSAEASASKWTQDPDTLDTWFSSGLWTFSTLGWPATTEDLKLYHPTDVLETGYEILFFWVARMILMSGYALEQIPFHTVYLHGTVRDAQGRKMSKSLGNGIDPIDIAAKFGADAGRMALVVGNTPGTDSRISEDKIRAYKYFANKLWNIARFVLMSVSEEQVKEFSSTPPTPATDADKKILLMLNATISSVTDNLDRHVIHEAANQVYQFTWKELADVYLEASKEQLTDESLKQSTSHMLIWCLTNTLKLVHPFAPFVTEELWGRLFGSSPASVLMIQRWPTTTP